MYKQNKEKLIIKEMIKKKLSLINTTDKTNANHKKNMIIQKTKFKMMMNQINKIKNKYQHSNKASKPTCNKLLNNKIKITKKGKHKLTKTVKE